MIAASLLEARQSQRQGVLSAAASDSLIAIQLAVSEVKTTDFRRLEIESTDGRHLLSGETKPVTNLSPIGDFGSGKRPFESSAA